jgi:hypothetical protein
VQHVVTRSEGAQQLYCGTDTSCIEAVCSYCTCSHCVDLLALLPHSQENHSPMRDSSNFGRSACGSPASVHGSPMKLVYPLPLLGEGPLSPAVLRTLAIAGRQAMLLVPFGSQQAYLMTVSNAPECPPAQCTMRCNVWHSARVGQTLSVAAPDNLQLQWLREDASDARVCVISGAVRRQVRWQPLESWQCCRS